MLDALRQIDGVDEKLLRRPEVGRLSSELEDGELPGAVVTNGRRSIAVATDRRILNICKSMWSNTISKIDSYPYAEIESITAGKGVFDNPLTVIIGGKRHRIEADKGRRHAFAEYVSARLPAPAMAKWEQEDKLSSHTSGKTELPQGTGCFDLKVVGESNYQDAIVRAERIADTDGHGNHFVKVTLLRESANPYDSNAVCVLSPGGQVMGYLARADAKAYAPSLDALDAAGYYVTCSATMGRGEHGYGVQLDLKTPEAVQVPEQGNLEPVEDKRSARSFHSDVYSKRVGNPDGPLFGEVVVFTGDMRMPRGELADISSTAGCRLDENVTKSTTILVLGVRDSAYEGNSTKHDKAIDYSKRFRPIEIINEEVFLSRLRDAGVQFDIERTADAKREYQKERAEETPASKSEHRWCRCGRTRYDVTKYEQCYQCFQDRQPVLKIVRYRCSRQGHWWTEEIEIGRNDVAGYEATTSGCTFCGETDLTPEMLDYDDLVLTNSQEDEEVGWECECGTEWTTYVESVPTYCPRCGRTDF